MSGQFKLSEETLRFLKWGLEVGRTFPTISPSNAKLMPPIDKVDMSIIQACKLDSLLFLVDTQYSRLQTLYDDLWRFMQQQAHAALREISSLTAEVAAIHGLYSSNRFYGGRAFGRRSDVDIFCPIEHVDQVADVIQSCGFEYLAIDDVGNLIRLNKSDVQESKFEQRFQFGKRMALCKCIPFEIDDEIKELIPERLLPLIKIGDKFFCYFGIETTFHFGENLKGDVLKDYIISDSTTELKYSLAPELSILVNLRRVEDKIHSFGEVKYQPLIDVLKIIDCSEVDWSKFVNMCAIHGDIAAVRTINKLHLLAHGTPAECLQGFEHRPEVPITLTERIVLDPMFDLRDGY